MQVAKKMIREKLQSIYPQEEIDSFIKLIFEKVLGLTRLEMHLHQNDSIPDTKLTQISEILDRLAKHEPIQYILGETDFYGLRFKVAPDVLIPRPETEELVDWILHEMPLYFSSLLDIGTGSGCIPISIAKSSKLGRVEGWDISAAALKVAQENALSNNALVHFSMIDILQWNKIPEGKKWDIIVSNPPYVTLKEKEAMAKNVAEFEPHLALFVPDNDPLLFYRAIMEFALQNVGNGGYLYFEINENLGQEVKVLLQSGGFVDIILRKDINEKDRMVRAKKP